MKKLKLHWQIVIALLLAIIVGMVVPTKFKFKEISRVQLKDTSLPDDLLAKVKQLEELPPLSETAFTKKLTEAVGDVPLTRYKNVMLKAAYYNPYLPYLTWMGDLFLRALRMLILPLILSSIVSSVANLRETRDIGALGLKTITYYIATSLIAIVTGQILVNMIKPGVGINLGFMEAVEGFSATQSSFLDVIMGIVPTNIFVAMTDNNTLSIIFSSMLFGFFITKVSEAARDFLTNLFNYVFEVVMKITLFIVKLAPFGIFGIVVKVVADRAGDADKLLNLAQNLGAYMLVVLIGLAIHFFLTLPLLVYWLGKAHPYKLLKNMSVALLTAFSTCSSGATLPLTMEYIQNKCGVSKKISSFVIPLGATINMDGTALYECVATIFIAQAYGIELSLGTQMIVVITSLLASIGAAAVPMSGFFMLSIILSAVGLPLEGVGLILAVDRILDMFRTTTNVWSDVCGTAIIAKSEGEKLLV